jgi:hypothetical protein
MPTNPYSDARREQHGEPKLVEIKPAGSVAQGSREREESRRSGEQVVMASLSKHRREGGWGRALPGSLRDPFPAFREEDSHAKSGSKNNSWLPAEKRCSNCSRWLPLEEFPANRRMHLGVSSHCRRCQRAATKDWRNRSRERINAERREEYRREHPLPSRQCVVCGRPFTKRPDALVCGEECRRERKREQRAGHRRAA